MSTQLSIFTFTKGAKRDLVALNNAYTYSDIVGMVRRHRKKFGYFESVSSGSLVIHLQKNKITGVSLDHLKNYPRTNYFSCEICFDSKKVQVGDDCDYCDGEWGDCPHCTDGLIFHDIDCPNCTELNTLRSNVNERSNKYKDKQQRSNHSRRRV